MLEDSPLGVTESDKFFWHRYGGFYESLFLRLPSTPKIFEFGTFRGDSVRYLLNRFPSASIVSADIITPPADLWPEDRRVEYVHVDQGDTVSVRRALGQSKLRYDLIIEDGSHDPVHQKRCLLESLEFLSVGGIYLVEDIHTSSSELRKKGVFKRRSNTAISVSKRIDRAVDALSSASTAIRITAPIIPRRRRRIGSRQSVNLFSLLLALERRLQSSKKLSASEILQLSSTGFFSSSEIEQLQERAQEVYFYRRMGLPLSCFRCGSDNFDVSRLLCACGTAIYTDDDSMVAAVVVS